MKEVLVIVAHPCDEVLGCGGVIAKYANNGDRISCLFLTDQSPPTHEFLSEESTEKVRQRKSEAKQAKAILGLKNIYFETFPAGEFGSVDLLDIAKPIKEIIESIEPEIIYTHQPGDLRTDHQIVFQATKTVCQPMRNRSVKEIYSFEIPFSFRWNLPVQAKRFEPTTFIDIGETFEKKAKAFKMYQDEIQKYPHPKSPEALEISARYQGLRSKNEMAEAFSLYRKID